MARYHLRTREAGWRRRLVLNAAGGRAHIAGLEPGSQIRQRGTVGIGRDGHPAMINPAYELLT